MVPDKKDKPLRTGEAAVPVLDRAVYKRLSRKLYSPARREAQGSLEGSPQRITDEIASACSEEGLVISSTSDIRVEVSPAVTGPVIIGTASGEPWRVQLLERAPDLRADQASAGTAAEGAVVMSGTAASEKAVVMSGMAAAEAAFLISRSREEDRLKRFPVPMVLRCAQMENLFSVRRAAEIAWKCGSGGGVMVRAGAGGVYAALWKLREKCMTGFSVQIRQIPVLQEAIEIAEYYGFDVYAAASAGCLLMTTDDAEQLLLRLRGEGIPAAVIGRTKGQGPETLKPGGKGADKPRRPGAAELVNGDETRYLDYPPADAVPGFI